MTSYEASWQPATTDLPCPRCGDLATVHRHYPNGLYGNGIPVNRYYCAPCDHEWWSDGACKGHWRPMTSDRRWERCSCCQSVRLAPTAYAHRSLCTEGDEDSPGRCVCGLSSTPAVCAGQYGCDHGLGICDAGGPRG